MASPVKEVPRQSQEGDESTLAELRERVAALAKEVAEIAERRAKVAGETVVNAAETGVDELRRGIRRQPVVAMAAAAAVGALLALAVAPRSRPRASRWDAWTPNVTRADLYDLADNIQRSVSRAANAAAAPVTPAFERMVDALSRADTSAVNSLIDRMGGWFQKAQDKAKDKMR
ncbi:MAG: hypothetical protein ACK4TP_15655 [Hyphomicrobium sp.]|jgi:ElaB/YqjD/DUF883 family membrane-anchored ribosome-binding protein